MKSKAPYIVGIGQSAYLKRGGITDRSELTLACEVIKEAAEDAGIDLAEIDGIVSYANDRNEPLLIQDRLGLSGLRYSAMAWGGGGNGACAPFLYASSAIESGRANHIIIVRSLCQGQFRRYGQFNPERQGNNSLAPFGMFSPPIMMAPIAQRYMHDFGIRQEHLGEVALVCRDNAQRNPNAVMAGRPLTMDEYLRSRPIATPLRLLDCCQESDGACALLVTTRERARDLRQRPVAILGAAHGNDPGWGTGGFGAHDMPSDAYGAGNGSGIASDLYKQADVKPDDIDVAQIYDHFTPFVLMTLENYGFCKPGETAAFLDGGGIRWPNGRLPINTSGGNLSEAYIHGLNLAVEGVRQMRGASTSQVKQAELCLVTGALGGGLTSAAIFGRD
jgi:acetyl-CoA acetyltransferase